MERDMDVGETQLRKVLAGDQRYRVPLYQRPYSWTEKQLERLWSDLLEVTDELRRNERATHFTGSLVLDLGRAGPGVNEYLVVDGQQRLTTLSVLLCAIRDHIAENDTDHPEKHEAIHERYIVDKYATGDDRLKLLPTQADRDAYRSIVDRTPIPDAESRIAIAYRFFRLQLQLADDPDDPHDVDRILEAALGGLAFVSITARGDDNVYRIFESLNNTGMKLTQGDLLRNYIFMRLGSRGDEVYTSWWLPMQDRLSSSDLEAIFWMDLVVTDSEAKQNDIYSAQRDRLDQRSADEVFAEVVRFAELSTLLALLREPESDNQFGETVTRRLGRLKSWGAVSADPLVLHLLARTKANRLSIADLESCLAILESFLVRRLLVGASPSALTRILFRAVSDMRSDLDVPDALLQYFSTGRKFFASNEQVRDAILTKPFYFMGKPNQKKLLLQWLEDTYGSKEPIDLRQASIEHVLPQTLTPYWRDTLAASADADESAEAIHEALVHTLGNLTLTGYNSELSNRDFPEKAEMLGKSGIRLNADIANKATWSREEILARGNELADRILKNWVPPIDGPEIVDGGATWALVREAVEAIPAGRWTTYGDLAALASTYPQPVAGFVSRNMISGAWRVMQAAGTISPGFSWGSRSEFAGQSAREVLEAEGVVFDVEGHANPGQRLASVDLAHMLGIDLGVQELSSDDPEVDEERFARFADQLTGAHPAAESHAVLALLDAWRDLGGYLDFGSQGETSCFLMARPGRRDSRGVGIWPLTVYPKSGTVEVVFQYLKSRAPFDRQDFREQLRSRLNRVDGIDIPAEALERRPSFRINVLEAPEGLNQVIEVLSFFMDRVAEAAEAGRAVTVNVRDQSEEPTA
jgi:alkylated DNA nucleotide flippase Atl1